MKTLQLRNSVNRSASRRGFLLVVLAWLALLPAARAVNPPPDGAYPNGNTAEGDSALFSLTSGSDNTAIGAGALYSNSAGYNNTATGFQTLNNNTTGYYNTATGFRALHINTTGRYNTATGFEALFSNTSGAGNTATGLNALQQNTTGSFNTAHGVDALFSNTYGTGNTAHGVDALQFNTTGSYNTANGVDALCYNNNGTDNTGVGYEALLDSTGSYNVALGAGAGSNLTSGTGNVCIGAYVEGVAGESNTTRIKNVYASVASGRVVYVNSDNKIGTLASSRRFKEEIKPMDKASEAILALKPVTFRYKKEIDPARTRSFGLIAEEVAEISPDLTTRDEEGNPQTVRYDAVNAMLLNEFLKEHRKVAQQATIIAQQRKDFQTSINKLQTTVAQQQKGMEALNARLEEQASQIQKVSAQIELGKRAPQMTLNDR